MSPRTGDSGTPEIVEGNMENCETCHGDMVIEVWDDNSQSYVEQNCPTCGGRGQAEIPIDVDDDYDLSRSFMPRQDENKQLETDEFDKFMDGIVGDEKQRAKVDPQAENNPRRLQAARYQDRPMNKTRWGGRRG